MHESYGILNIFVGIHLSSISVIVVKAASQRALAARGVAAPVVPKEVEVRGLHQPTMETVGISVQAVTLPETNSSPLKSYQNPIGKDRLPSTIFFRGELLNFRAVPTVITLSSHNHGKQ